MACQLTAEGEEIELLALLDAYPAGYFKLLPGSGSFTQSAVRYEKKIQTHRKTTRRRVVVGKLY